ncbi:alpha/beta hydrolase [Kitasatospora sp. NPDC049258]|uniref:alpha/beta hydrolase n=1 Tax=Kitasatospora sp. NPDC049258 TaxID=3155394 RepID=UPI003441228D
MTDLPQDQDTGWPPPPFLPPPPPHRSDGGVLRYDGVTYARSFGYRPRLLDVYVPARPAPVPAVVWIHGGGWMDGDRRYPPPTVPADLLFGSLLAAGLAVVTIDYRHSLEAAFPAQLHDVKAAIRYVRHFAPELGIDGERIGVFGESAGGHLTAMAALTDQDSDGGRLEGTEGVLVGSTAVRCAVDWYGVSDIGAAAAAFPAPAGSAALEVPAVGDPYTALLGASPADRPDLAAGASPVSHVPAVIPPFLLIHGTEDNLVPYSQSERLAEHLTAQGGSVELVPVHGADHIFLGSAEIPAIVGQSVAFLARHLAATTG